MEAGIMFQRCMRVSSISRGRLQYQGSVPVGSGSGRAVTELADAALHTGELMCSFAARVCVRPVGSGQ